MILLNGGVPIAFSRTEEPTAEILQTKLYIDSSRFYIKFCDVQVKLLICPVMACVILRRLQLQIMLVTTL